jgi:DNA-binding protein HU-beta
MHRQELIAAVTNATQLNKKLIAESLDAILSQISEALANSEEVTLRGFGSFKISERKARQGRNPRTGEAISIPATKAIAFKPSKELKDKMNG